jgi:hypothetical protein
MGNDVMSLPHLRTQKAQGWVRIRSGQTVGQPHLVQRILGLAGPLKPPALPEGIYCARRLMNASVWRSSTVCPTVVAVPFLTSTTTRKALGVPGTKLSP